MGDELFSNTTFFDINVEDIEGLLAEPDHKPLDLLAKETVAKRVRIAKVWNE